MLKISVIICAHNPRRDYLARTLDALRIQTLPLDLWELILVDNASDEMLSKMWDLSWHSNGRHVIESELGLTPARFRGVRESKSDLLVFVDDDNVLDPEYLANALGISLSHSWIGAFGGDIQGEFEVMPDPEYKMALPHLALVDVRDECWALGPGSSAINVTPYGAGMVIRKVIAEHYAKVAADSPLRKNLDRKGKSLSSAGDLDMALCACELGFAIGRFPALKIVHLIGAQRVKCDYLLNLVEASTFSVTVLEYLWDSNVPEAAFDSGASLCRSEKLFRLYRRLRMHGGGPRKASFADLFNEAASRGRDSAGKFLRQMLKDGES